VGGRFSQTSRGPRAGEGLTANGVTLPPEIVENIDNAAKRADRLSMYLTSSPHAPGPHTLQSALLVAVRNSAPNDVQMLLEEGAIASFNNNQPLVEACLFGRTPGVTQVIKNLVAAGANVHHMHEDCLKYVCGQTDPDSLVKFQALIECGADVSILTAYQIETTGNPAVHRALIKLISDAALINQVAIWRDTSISEEPPILRLFYEYERRGIPFTIVGSASQTVQDRCIHFMVETCCQNNDTIPLFPLWSYAGCLSTGTSVSM
jgi:hypothetical protein